MLQLFLSFWRSVLGVNETQAEAVVPGAGAGGADSGPDGGENAAKAPIEIKFTQGLYHELRGEFVLDAFRLNKHSRLHGQAGGYTIKGGDFRTALAEIRAAARTEYAPVDKSGERRDKATGFRLVVVPASLPSQPRLQAIRGLWTNLAQAAPGSAGQALADPVKEVEALAKAANDPGLKARIEGVGTVIKANIQARNEQRDRSAKSEIRVGAYLAKKVMEDRTKVARLQDFLKQAGFGKFDALPGSLDKPLALAYHGHQFQSYNPNIGDGRGFLFAQMRDDAGRLLDLGQRDRAARRGAAQVMAGWR